MAKKKEVSQEIIDLKKELEDKRVIFGTKQSLKLLKDGLLNKAYLANNCSVEIKEDIVYNAGLARVQVIMLKMDNEELGSLCKKHFFVSVLGVKKK
jgi:ribosomal protein L30E